MLLIKKGRMFYVRVAINGSSTEIATGTSDRAVAQRVKKSIESDVAARKFMLPTQTRLSDAVEAFVGYLKANQPEKSAVNDVSRLRQVFGTGLAALAHDKRARENTPETTALSEAGFVEKITPQMIQRHLDTRSLDVGPSTLRAEREILHRFFNFCAKRFGYVAADRTDTNPVSHVAKPRVRQAPIVYLTPPEIIAQLEALKDHPPLRAAVALMIYAGVRREEALWLMWRDSIDFAGEGWVRVLSRVDPDTGERWHPKTQASRREIPMSTSLRVELVQYHKAAKSSPWVIHDDDGRRWKPDNFSKKLAYVNKQKGLSWTALHYRHTFGSLLAQSGESIYQIARWMGNGVEVCQKHYAALQRTSRFGGTEFMNPTLGRPGA